MVLIRRPHEQARRYMRHSVSVGHHTSALQKLDNRPVEFAWYNDNGTPAIDKTVPAEVGRLTARAYFVPSG